MHRRHHWYTRCPDVRDEVMLFGEDAYGRKDASDVAAIYAARLSYEVFTGIKERVPRVLVE
jgi:alanine racemase